MYKAGMRFTIIRFERESTGRSGRGWLVLLKDVRRQIFHTLTDSNFALDMRCVDGHQITRFQCRTFSPTPLTAHVLPCWTCLLTSLALIV